METGEKEGLQGRALLALKVFFISLLVCVVAFLVYQLPVFWTRPATAEYLPEEGKGAYLGISAAELRKLKINLISYRAPGLLPVKGYYEKKKDGGLFEVAHYTADFYGRIKAFDFSRHFKAQELEKQKYEYLKIFISRYGEDYKKALRVHKPYTNIRYTYELFVWEKKDARITLEFSFYDNNNKNGYISKDRGVFLHIGYPGATGENFSNKIIADSENPELKERFRLNFPAQEKLKK